MAVRGEQECGGESEGGESEVNLHRCRGKCCGKMEDNGSVLCELWFTVWECVCGCV